MIVDKHISIWRLLKIIWLRLLIMFFIATAGALFVLEIGARYIIISEVIPSILGTALSIFLGFRTNSAFDRWMKARGFWSNIMAISENFAMTLSRVDGEEYINYKTGKPSKIASEVMPRMIRRNIAWAWSLNYRLKGMPELFELDKYIEADELAALQNYDNPGLKMLYLQSRDFRIASSEHQFIDGEHFELVIGIKEMITAQHSCEGLKATPFPTHYTFFTDIFIWMLVLLMSVSLPAMENVGYFSILAVFITGWVFSMINGIGAYMEEPFVNNRNFVPMNALCRKLERDLLQNALGEKNIPPHIKPIEGALY